MNSLLTDDIAGATTSTRGLGCFANVKRRDGQNPNNLRTDDIEGAAASTLRKCPKTIR